jgi:hypothetical protein
MNEGDTIMLSPLLALTLAVILWQLGKLAAPQTCRVVCSVAPSQERATLSGYTATAYPLAADRWWIAVTAPNGHAAWHTGEVTRTRDEDGREWYAVPGDTTPRPSLRSACRTVANLHAAAALGASRHVA